MSDLELFVLANRALKEAIEEYMNELTEIDRETIELFNILFK